MSQAIPVLEYGRFYHIYNRGNGGENVFREERNYAFFMTQYAKYVEPAAETYAYCLLKNHFHLLVRVRDDKTFRVSGNPKGLASPKGLNPPTQAFSNFFNAYAKAFNKTYQRTGSLFQKPFGRMWVDDENYFANLVHYIHFNPQKHGFAQNFREWHQSSYHAFYSAKPSRLQRGQVLEWFHGRDEFEAVHRHSVNERLVAKWVGEDPD
jgi:REP element-mobilizing transposase RayT